MGSSDGACGFLWKTGVFTTRLTVHSVAFTILVFGCVATHYCLLPFIERSSQHDAPAALLAWCTFFPATIIFAYQCNHVLLTDPQFPSMAKVLFLCGQLLLILVLIGESAKNPVFKCHISECTYDKLPPPEDNDEETSTWHKEEGKAIMDLLYFSFGLFLMPFYLYLIYDQLFVLFKINSAGKHTFAWFGDDVISNPTTEMTDIYEAKSQNIDAVNPMNKDISESADEAKVDIAQRTKTLEELTFTDYESKIERKQAVDYVSYFLVFVLLFPLHLFCTTRFGNDFQWFSNYGIAAWGRHKIEPEIPHIERSVDLNYKFFPQILLFYGFIYFMVLLSMISKCYPRLQNWFKLGSKAAKEYGWGITNGELLFSIVFVAFTFGTFGYVFGHWYAKPHVKWLGSATSERWGRCLGQTALFPMGLMILPISRNSIWAKLMDYSWENMLKFHKCMAIVFIVLSAAHMFAFWGVFASMGDFPNAIMDNPNKYRPEDATISVNQALFIAVIIPVFCGLTLPFFRRFYFEWFYFTHFLATVLFCAILWHADFAWMYIIPGLTLYMIDHMVRFCKMIRPIEVISMRALPDDVTEIKFGIQTNPGWVKPQDVIVGGPIEKKSVDVGTGVEGIHFESGQFVWLQIPEVDQIQAHPFNIACSQYDPYTTCFIKSQGENTWTGKLYELAKVAGEAHPNNPYPIKSTRLFVDGPYGNRFSYEKYNSILLIAGGIGITGVHSIIRTLIQICNSDKGLPENAILRKVRLVWVMKDPDLLYGNEMLMYTLQMIPPLEGSPEYNKLMWGGAPPPPSPGKKKKRKSKTKVEEETENPLVIEDADSSSGIEFTERDFSFNQGAADWRASHADTSSNDMALGVAPSSAQSLDNDDRNSEMGRPTWAADKRDEPRTMAIIRNGVRFEVALYCTSEENDKEKGQHYNLAKESGDQLVHPLLYKRPDLETEIARMEGNPLGCVHVSGPNTLINTVHEFSNDKQVVCYGESADF